MDASSSASIGAGVWLMGVCGEADGATLCVDPLLTTLVQVSLALLFASTAWHKLRDLSAFEAVFMGYQLMPRLLVPVATRALVAVEVAAAQVTCTQ